MCQFAQNDSTRWQHDKETSPLRKPKYIVKWYKDSVFSTLGKASDF
jgi:hypothetical protein